MSENNIKLSILRVAIITAAAGLQYFGPPEFVCVLLWAFVVIAQWQLVKNNL